MAAAKPIFIRMLFIFALVFVSPRLTIAGPVKVIVTVCNTVPPVEEVFRTCPPDAMCVPEFAPTCRLEERWVGFRCPLGDLRPVCLEEPITNERLLELIYGFDPQQSLYRW